MSEQDQVFYASANGDTWSLWRGREDEPEQVRHRPARASGGQSSLTSVEAFLAEGHGPQHEALLQRRSGTRP